MYLTGEVATNKRVIVVETDGEAGAEAFSHHWPLHVDSFLGNEHFKRHFEPEFAVLKNDAVFWCNEFIRPGIIWFTGVKLHIMLHPLAPPRAWIKDGFDPKWLT